jgi:hypothetical protein
VYPLGLHQERRWGYLSIQETLYLSQVKGLKESLIEGKNTPVEECIPLEELEW